MLKPLMRLNTAGHAGALYTRTADGKELARTWAISDTSCSGDRVAHV